MIFIKSTRLRVITILIVFICFMLLLPGLDESLALESKCPSNVTPSPIVEEAPQNVSDNNNQATIILINTPEPTAEPTPTAAPTPSPTPFIHPGDRDDKFTDGEIVGDENSYQSKDLNIEIKTIEQDESVMYVAEIYMRSLDNFKPVFANGAFDNGYRTTSEMDEKHNGVLTINSDSATAVDYGVIIRNQKIYRNVPSAEHMAIYYDGRIETYKPQKANAKWLIEQGAAHVFCFGPTLINMRGEAIDDFSFSHIQKRHPRTAIGMIEPYHYVIVVVDGRSSYSKGMTLEQMSQVMYDLGCKVAYNLDGGGSSTMVFRGERINKPEGGDVERELDSAIVILESP